MTDLAFGYDYNQITDIPNSVTYLTFGERYNQITEIPSNVICLKHNGTIIKIGEDTEIFKFTKN